MTPDRLPGAGPTSFDPALAALPVGLAQLAFEELARVDAEGYRDVSRVAGDGIVTLEAFPDVVPKISTILSRRRGPADQAAMRTGSDLIPRRKFE